MISNRNFFLSHLYVCIEPVSLLKLYSVPYAFQGILQMEMLLIFNILRTYTLDQSCTQSKYEAVKVMIFFFLQCSVSGYLLSLTYVPRHSRGKLRDQRFIRITSNYPFSILANKFLHFVDMKYEFIYTIYFRRCLDNCPPVRFRVSVRVSFMVEGQFSSIVLESLEGFKQNAP